MPAPRDRIFAERMNSMHLAMIYMASGFASRFGENKLLVPFRGKPLYLHGMEHLAEAARLLEQEGAAEISLLAVSQYGEILAKGREMGYIPVPNSRSREGITASLRLGTLGAGEAEAYLYFVADQPFMGGETIRAFVSGFLKSKKGIGCAARGSGRGSPVIFSSKYRESLLGLSGDKGGRQIMERFPRDIWAMQVKGEELLDIDRREDMEAAERGGPPADKAAADKAAAEKGTAGEKPPPEKGLPGV